MRSKSVSLVVSLLLVGAAESLAQAGPPAVLVITREQFKPGNMVAHNKHIPAFYALFDKAKVGAYRLGLLPLSGDQNHLLYLEGYPSFAEVEATGKRMDEAFAASAAWQAELDALSQQTDSLHDSQTVMLAVRRPDLSYRALTPDGVARSRYLTLTTTRVNIGRISDYADYTKQTNAAREKASLDEHTTVWQVTSGAPAGTFLLFTFSGSMAEADEFRKGLEARSRKLNEALGGDDVVKQRQAKLSQIVAQTSSSVYAVNRAISRPSPEFVAADPDFWKPTTMAKKEPAQK